MDTVQHSWHCGTKEAQTTLKFNRISSSQMEATRDMGAQQHTRSSRSDSTTTIKHPVLVSAWRPAAS
jgi:hypothetical protein